MHNKMLCLLVVSICAMVYILIRQCHNGKTTIKRKMLRDGKLKLIMCNALHSYPTVSKWEDDYKKRKCFMMEN